MRKLKFILLIIIVLFQSCKNEIEEKSNIKETQHKQIEKFCFINNVHQTNGITSLALDIIEYKKISDLDSTIKSSQIIELPNGFCYVNEKAELKNLEILKNAKIIMQSLSHKEDGSYNFNQKINLDRFVEVSKSNKFKMLKLSPFKIISERGKVVLLEEIYLP
jgi:PBP1b-binding outer membrane lipoprotein LpoB